jgi:hypothetical protein
LTQRTHSQRAIGVISCHRFWIFCGGSRQSCRKILRNARFWPILGHLDVQRHNVTYADASGVLQRVIDSHPVARIPVWFEHRLELDAIDRPVDGYLPARGKILARRLRQPHHSRCVDRGQRGVETNGRSLCALTHRRLSPSPFWTRHPDCDTVIECVTVDTLQPSGHETRHDRPATLNPVNLTFPWSGQVPKARAGSGRKIEFRDVGSRPCQIVLRLCEPSGALGRPARRTCFYAGERAIGSGPVQSFGRDGVSRGLSRPRSDAVPADSPRR